MRASAAGNVELVALLLAHGDVNALDDRGRTALMRACQAGHPEVVRLLLEKGAEKGARGDDGATALELARTEEVRRLLR
jgi:ankyrin repeat protein